MNSQKLLFIFSFTTIFFLSIMPCSMAWDTFTANESGFLVELPGTPTAMKKTLKIKGAYVSMFLYTLSNSDGEYSIVATLYPPQQFDMSKPESVFREATGKLVSNPDFKLLSKRPLEYMGLQGQELIGEIKSQGITLYSRAYLHKQILYQLVFAPSSGSKASADRFFNSFKLIPQRNSTSSVSLQRAMKNSVKQKIVVIKTALDLFRLDTGKYPDKLSDLIVNNTGIKNWEGPYLNSQDQIIDAWGNNFFYLNPGVYGDYDLISYGADGLKGGSGVNKDINSAYE